MKARNDRIRLLARLAGGPQDPIYDRERAIDDAHAKSGGSRDDIARAYDDMASRGYL